MHTPQDNVGLKLNILYVILKKPQNHWRWLPPFFHTPQKYADKNWGVFSKTHFKPDLHIPSLLSSAVLLGCFNMQDLGTYSLVCPKHPFVSSSSFQRSTSAKEAAFPEVPELPVPFPASHQRKSPATSQWLGLYDLGFFCIATYGSRYLGCSEPFEWDNMQKDCKMIYPISPSWRGEKRDPISTQGWQWKYNNYSSRSTRKKEDFSKIHRWRVTCIAHSRSMTQNKPRWTPRIGIVVTYQWPASGCDRPLCYCPFSLWSATFFKWKFFELSVEVIEDLLLFRFL